MRWSSALIFSANPGEMKRPERGEKYRPMALAAVAAGRNTASQRIFTGFEVRWIQDSLIVFATKIIVLYYAPFSDRVKLILFGREARSAEGSEWSRFCPKNSQEDFGLPKI
jgi:hypothetical protein